MQYRVGKKTKSRKKRVTLVGTALSFVVFGGLMGAHGLDALGSGPIAGSDRSKPASTNSLSNGRPGGSKSSSPGKPKAAVAAAPVTTPTTPKVGCGPVLPTHSGLAAAQSPQLRKLSEYETICGGSVVDRMSFFVPMPSTVEEARALAAEVASTLQEFSRLHIAPLVYLEPNGGSGPIDLAAYHAGRYDAVMDTYYAAIKAAGITDAMMGLWVLFPEANLPEWTSINPADFTANVTKTARLQKNYFPGSQATILLDGKTYPSATSWEGGQYVSLLPYVSGIPAGLLDSFGLQGFPWAAPANHPGEASLFDPNIYLPSALAAEAARALGTAKIWLNTGTMNQAYSRSPAQTINLAAAQRQAMLAGVVAQGRLLQSQGFTIAVHLFAENKSGTAEGIDWSYWHDPNAETPAKAILQEFVRTTAGAHFAFWLSDAPPGS